MKPELYTRVVVTLDLPQEDVRRGDIATIVEYLPHPNGGEDGAILEIFDTLGNSLGVVTVPVSAITSLTHGMVPTARPTTRSA
ncbi:MAG TPA: hypothetical protein VFU60_18055 [Ktedonobacterales bacterium]|nr:hypothetical protein [Ktedonobacterales bacterium]